MTSVSLCSVILSCCTYAYTSLPTEVIRQDDDGDDEGQPSFSLFCYILFLRDKCTLFFLYTKRFITKNALLLVIFIFYPCRSID